MKIRVRIAPSPTGFLHIGTARTALFNWLFAKKQDGALILRIEDTDTERSKPEFEKNIIEELRWLGIQWDEGPIRQSERTAFYKKYLEQLLNDGHAYYCACTREELDSERNAMLEQGIAPRYSGHCRDKKLPAAPQNVIRFVMPTHTISFTDLIRGHIEFNGELIGDFVIAKNTATPLYNFAVVVDDEDMNITQVIRGEDGISNTPKQIALQKALNFKHPHYAHLPLILDHDRSKMSKRNSATAISEYRAAGYLPEAIINYLALLGWHPQDNREIMNQEELIKTFDLKRVQKAGAIFSLQKLNWMNAQYIKKTDTAKLVELIGGEASEKNHAIVHLLKSRAQTLNDFITLGSFFFELPPYESALLQWKTMTPEEIKISLERTAEYIRNNRIEEIKTYAETRGRGETFWPLRVALSGLSESPGPLEIITILGREESVRRIKKAIEKLKG